MIRNKNNANKQDEDELLYSYSVQNKNYKIKHPKDIPDTENLVVRERNLELKGVNGYVREIIFDHIYIEKRNVKIDQDLEIKVSHNAPLFKMHFELSGYSNYTAKSKNSLDVFIDNNCHQLFFFPKVEGNLNYKAGSDRNTLEIALTLDFLYTHFGKELKALGMLGKAIINNTPIVVGTSNNHITSEMTQVVHQIMDCPVHNILQQKFLEIKIIELLILQINQFNKEESSEKYIQINRIDEKINELTNYLQNNLRSTKTIEELAIMLGVNSTKLKYEFKKKHQLTIYNFGIKHKMEHALLELQNSSKNITEIANEIGYNHVQHFSKAFKKFHGKLPREYRK